MGNARRLTREHLTEVAAVYAEAVADGFLPGAAIAARWDVPVATAQRWVYQARLRGVMTPTRKGSIAGRVTPADLLADELGVPRDRMLAALAATDTRVVTRLRQGTSERGSDRA